MARGNTWTNSDGLVVGFGTHTEDNDVPAEANNGVRKAVYVEIDLTDLADAFAAANRKPQEVRIPRGSVITSAYLEVLTAATSSGGGTLDIGTWGVGDAADDPNGIVDAVTVTEMSEAGELHICDGAMVGASGNSAPAGDAVAVGGVSDSDVVIAPSYDTAVFQTGVVALHVEYLAPSGSTGGTIAVVSD